MPTVPTSRSSHSRSGLRPGDRERQHDVLLGGEHREQVEELEDEAELVAAQLGQVAVVEAGELGAVDLDRAAGRPVEPGEDVHQRGLAGARRAHDRAEAAALEVDAHAVERVDGGVALAERRCRSVAVTIAAAGGRPRRPLRRPEGGEGRGGDAGGLQRAHPGPRVRRRRLAPGRPRPRPLRRLRRPAPLPAAARRGAGGDHARAGDRRRPALRRLPRHPRRRHGRLRAGGARRGRSREPDRRAAARRLEPTVLASGRDFYSFPRVSPDGAGSPGPAGTTRTCPGTGPSSGWRRSTIPRRRGSSPAARRSRSSSPSGTPRAGCTSSPTATAGGTSTAPTASRRRSSPRSEADLAHPQWLFGGSTYAFLADGSIVCVRCERGEERLFALDPGASGCATSASRSPPSASPRCRLARRSSPSPPPARRGRPRSSCSTSPAARRRPVRAASEETVDPAYVSVPRAIEFPTSGGETAHGFYYPPANADFAGPEGELPPLIVQSHGGPTSHATPALDREFAYWTSRGFGVVDVNYRGSSGYGRAYRERCAATGASSTPTTASPPPATWPRPARSTASGWRSAAAAPAATRPSARSSSTTTSPPAPATTASPTPRRWPRTPTSSSRATSTA